MMISKQIENINRFAETFSLRQKVELIRIVSQVKHINRIRRARLRREYQLREENNYLPAHSKHSLTNCVLRDELLNYSDKFLNRYSEISKFFLSKRNCIETAGFSFRQKHSNVTFENYYGLNTGTNRTLTEQQKECLKGNSKSSHTTSTDFLYNLRQKEHINRIHPESEKKTDLSQRFRMNRFSAVNDTPRQVQRKQWERRKVTFGIKRGDSLENKSQKNISSDIKTDYESPNVLESKTCAKLKDNVSSDQKYSVNEMDKRDIIFPHKDSVCPLRSECIASKLIKNGPDLGKILNKNHQIQRNANKNTNINEEKVILKNKESQLNTASESFKKKQYNVNFSKNIKKWNAAQELAKTFSLKKDKNLLNHKLLTKDMKPNSEKSFSNEKELRKKNTESSENSSDSFTHKIETIFNYLRKPNLNRFTFTTYSPTSANLTSSSTPSNLCFDPTSVLRSNNSFDLVKLLKSDTTDGNHCLASNVQYLSLEKNQQVRPDVLLQKIAMANNINCIEHPNNYLQAEGYDVLPINSSRFVNKCELEIVSTTDSHPKEGMPSSRLK